MNTIDFVVTWVDGNDPDWLREREQYMPSRNDSGTSVNRYRDWGLMRYWFRAVEKFAPWVNKVYFVTWGHYPEWLNLDNPKLMLVNHKDYIPHEYLPTYNTNVIELNLHRISELSEHFVLFNDDVFLTDHVTETDFFVKGVPCDVAMLGQLSALTPEDVFPHMILNNMAVINKYFDKKTVVRDNWSKFFSLKYGKEIIRNILLYNSRYFSCFYEPHLTIAFRKKAYEEIWEKEPMLLANTSRNKFRTKDDVTDWLIKAWQTCKGQIVPRRFDWGKCFSIGDDADITKAITSGEYKVICLNDSNPNLDFEKNQAELVAAFEEILPDKCSFEMY